MLTTHHLALVARGLPPQSASERQRSLSTHATSPRAPPSGLALAGSGRPRPPAPCERVPRHRSNGRHPHRSRRDRTGHRRVSSQSPPGVACLPSQRTETAACSAVPRDHPRVADAEGSAGRPNCVARETRCTRRRRLPCRRAPHASGDLLQVRSERSLKARRAPASCR